MVTCHVFRRPHALCNQWSSSWGTCMQCVHDVLSTNIIHVTAVNLGYYRLASH